MVLDNLSSRFTGSIDPTQLTWRHASVNNICMNINMSSVGKVAFVFPGQGAQVVGMGLEACKNSARAREVFDEADAVLGYSLSKLCHQGPPERLALTHNTQPALLTCSIALLRALDERADMVAGHSLGEYSAYVAAGALEFADAVRVVHERGRYMQQAVPVGRGAMAAILSCERAVVERVCMEVEGVVEPANYNSASQVVIAGEPQAVAEAGKRLFDLGGKVRPVAVSAPFHCSLMMPAQVQLAKLLRQTDLSQPEMPVYANVNAAPVTTAGGARQALVRQVMGAVRWQQGIERMIADGVVLFVEVGPGRVLGGLIARINRRVKRVSVQGPADYDVARTAIACAREDGELAS